MEGKYLVEGLDSLQRIQSPSTLCTVSRVDQPGLDHFLPERFFTCKNIAP